MSKCPECDTRTLVREGEELVCSECKGRFPAPSGREPPPPKRNYHDIYKRHKFYESHRTEITRDLLTMGRTATKNKWGISGSTLPSLEKRWLAPAQQAMLNSMAVNPATSGGNRLPQLPEFSSSSVKPAGGKWLPQLPEFSSSWDPTVQLKWLEIYGELVGG